jgi:glycosyltransferase involved in cell wall biosynthesis
LTASPRISIIIPVYNHFVELDRCLQALQQSESSHRSEVIVIDDCSPKASGVVEQVALKYGAKYHRQAENTGPGIARNRGAELASGDILVFTDSDCVAPSDWLSKLTQPIRDGRCFATTACYCSPVTTSWITIFQNEDYLYRMPSIECDTYFVNSCNLAIKRDVFLDCGGFPEQRVSEDMVLGMLLAQNGTPARYLPEAGVQHDYYRNLTSYLKQRFSFAFNTTRSYLDHDNLQSAKVNSKVRSYNPIRTALGMFFSLVAVISLILAGTAEILNLDLAAVFLPSGLISLVLETVIHGRFLLFLIKRQGLGRSISCIFLLYMIDFVYTLGVLKGLAQAFHKVFYAIALSPESNWG